MKRNILQIFLEFSVIGNNHAVTIINRSQYAHGEMCKNRGYGERNPHRD